MFYFKFEFPDDDPQYLRSVNMFVEYINKYWDREYTLFARADWKTWQEVKTFIPGNCPCGRKYWAKDRAFVGIIHPDTIYLNFGEFLDIISKPWECYICFWQKEILLGNWAPKDVYKELGLPIPH